MHTFSWSLKPETLASKLAESLNTIRGNSRVTVQVMLTYYKYVATREKRDHSHMKLDLAKNSA